MKYLGLDVHLKSTVWCLLDEEGATVEHGSVETTVVGLRELLRKLEQHGELLCGQEVGTLCYFVNDIFIERGVKLLTFNAYQLRMIASSRKKTDKRDAYWLAKALQTGMTPHPVYLPSGEVRELRGLLSQRQALSRERVRWRVRARRMVQAAGFKPATGGSAKVTKSLEDALTVPETLAPYLADGVKRCLRMEKALALELKDLDKQLHQRVKDNDVLKRLMTIPGVGEQVALTLYATIGDISRFKSARELCSYAGLVPSVRQSGNHQTLGHVTKEGSPRLRSILVQAGHSLLWRCKSDQSLPLKALAQRVHTSRQRRKIAIVAAGRYILRTAYYVMRDGTAYDPSKLPAAA
ncbi:MAG TPA: IS110 family transposase [Rhodothermales bacterium]|nr:IS110 family transposase [Rhodothermales bacterium]